MKILIFDFEVFKKDILLGYKLIDETGKEEFHQTWSTDEIKQLYQNHINDIWIGHNNISYDNLILEAVINGNDPFLVSKNIIEKGYRYKATLPLISYDLMSGNFFSLKSTELFVGKNIHTTDVDFNLDRALTDEEKRLTEEYNKDDILQTAYNFEKFYSSFKLRLDIIKEFNLTFNDLNLTGTQIAAKVLKAKRIPDIEIRKVPPRFYYNLILENETVKQFYLNEDFRKGKHELIQIGNAELNIGAGGIHSAISKYHTDKVMYFDVSGYYNLIMINYDLLPRTIPAESTQLYNYMYHEQLRLKKIDPTKRKVYKTILLSVFGAMMNQYSDFYDPERGLLVTITGQLYLCDLLEKLQHLVKIVQANTDGIMVEPNNWEDEPKIIEIVEEWEKRTGFVIKKEHMFNLWQRDVNNYVCQDENGELIYKGEALSNYDVGEKAYASGRIFNCKEPPIIAQGIIQYLIYGVSPEEYVKSKQRDLTLFQYNCRKNTYDYTQYETLNKETNENLKEKLSGHDRAFASNDLKIIGSIIKYKNANGKLTKARISNLPPNVFIYNNEILSDSVYNKLKNKIDYQYYINRIYERCSEFIK